MSPNDVKKPKKRKPRNLKVTAVNTHAKNLVHEQVIIDATQQPVYEKWLFRNVDFPCGGCNKTSGIVFMRCPPLNNVVRSCKHCGITEPIEPRHPNTNEELAYLLETRRIPTDEVRRVIERCKVKLQFLHPVLLRIMTTPKKEKLNLDEFDLEE